MGGNFQTYNYITKNYALKQNQTKILIYIHSL